VPILARANVGAILSADSAGEARFDVRLGNLRRKRTRVIAEPEIHAVARRAVLTVIAAIDDLAHAGYAHFAEGDFGGVKVMTSGRGVFQPF
jgi:hypothetical protein